MFVRTNGCFPPRSRTRPREIQAVARLEQALRRLAEKSGNVSSCSCRWLDFQISHGTFRVEITGCGRFDVCFDEDYHTLTGPAQSAIRRVKVRYFFVRDPG